MSYGKIIKAAIYSFVMIAGSLLIVFSVVISTKDLHHDVTTADHTSKSSDTILLSSIDHESYDGNIQNGIYILNTKSKKIHVASCGIAKSIDDSNYASTDDIQPFLDSGYTSCGICMPSE